jgi:ADP-heptose:LPS heptosyltransferase
MNGKILIVAPNWIGDAVLSLPVVDGCGQLWQEAELMVLARTRVAELFETRESDVRVLEYERGNGPQRLSNFPSGWGIRPMAVVGCLLKGWKTDERNVAYIKWIITLD